MRHVGYLAKLKVGAVHQDVEFADAQIGFAQRAGDGLVNRVQHDAKIHQAVVDAVAAQPEPHHGVAAVIVGMVVVVAMMLLLLLRLRHDDGGRRKAALVAKAVAVFAHHLGCDAPGLVALPPLQCMQYGVFGRAAVLLLAESKGKVNLFGQVSGLGNVSRHDFVVVPEQSTALASPQQRLWTRRQRPTRKLPHRQNCPSPMSQVSPLPKYPKMLYIPPDALEIFLEAFEGPLDLLLYLIKRQNIDILDINVADITDQYMAYIDLLHEIQFELAAEYLVMAAMLAEIKSRMLLPRQEEEESEETDPRTELIRRLQEYERFKRAAEDLEDLPRMDRGMCTVLEQLYQ